VTAARSSSILGVTSYTAADESYEIAAPTPAPASGRGRWIAVAAVLLALAGAGTLFGKFYLTAPAVAEATGTLVVTTTPPGVPVFIDGQSRGMTPLTIELAPGAHELKLAADGEPRVIPFSINAGGLVAQTIELPKVAPSTGQLAIRSDPAGARVSIDGTARGVTPLTVEGLTPGAHRVALENDANSITQEVTIEAGATASLVVPMTAPQGEPLTGWIAVSAPAEVQLFENGRFLGTSASERVMLPAGRHDVDIVNEALGYRTMRTVVVSAGRVASIRVEWPKGSLSLNAQPWAEVWMNGERVGETPIGNLAVPVGNHEVIFRHPEFGEQVVRATVSATTPTRLSVDMRKR
jgi:hypothetical protein